MLCITPIHAFNDNYIWLLELATTNLCYLVDPGDADVCIKHMNDNNLQLAGILITHHHNDHIGGIAKLKQYCLTKNWPITVFGPKNEKINNIDFRVTDGESILLFERIQFKVMEVPGHTLDHIAYYGESVLFCGDTLFSGGCGRLFEGTAEQMFNSLTKLSSLPDSTLVYCAHEYTQANLRFALTVEPENLQLIQYKAEVDNKRERFISTIPTTIKQEKAINPFLRCHVLAQHKPTNNEASVEENLVTIFRDIRQQKDTF